MSCIASSSFALLPPPPQSVEILLYDLRFLASLPYCLFFFPHAPVLSSPCLACFLSSSLFPFLSSCLFCSSSAFIYPDFFFVWFWSWLLSSFCLICSCIFQPLCVACDGCPHPGTLCEYSKYLPFFSWTRKPAAGLTSWRWGVGEGIRLPQPFRALVTTKQLAPKTITFYA